VDQTNITIYSSVWRGTLGSPLRETTYMPDVRLPTYLISGELQPDTFYLKVEFVKTSKIFVELWQCYSIMGLISYVGGLVSLLYAGMFSFISFLHDIRFSKEMISTLYHVNGDSRSRRVAKMRKTS